MPFCNSCGNRVGDADRYCGRCGHMQPSGAAPGSQIPHGQVWPGQVPPGQVPPGQVPPALPLDPLAEIPPRTLAILCYLPVVGFVSSVIVLSARRFRKDLALRFHAFQGLYLFAAWLLVDWAIDPIFHLFPHHGFGLDHLLQLALIFVWVFMLVKTSHGQSYSLPVLGELAHRSAHER